MKSGSLTAFYEELKRRRVIRVATLYVIVFWPIIQLVDILSPALNLPDSMMRYLVIAFFGGLPFALILSWIFDLDRDGIHLDGAETTDAHASKPLLGSKAELALVALLGLLVAGLFIIQVNIDEDNPTNPALVEHKTVSPPAQAAMDTSIAVLPFVTFSEEPRDQFFADGLTEELLNVLARIPELRVAARTSSFAYRGVNKTVQKIGRELNVGTILEGSVRRNDVDNTVRITAQLISVRTGAHLWSKTFDRKFSDVFKIQDEISSAVANQLKVTLLGAAGSSGRNRTASANPEALIAYGMGQRELAKRTEASLNAAVEHFKLAITEDPDYALAYTGLADANTLLVNYKYKDFYAGAEAASNAIDKALALDPLLGIGWASKGLLLSLYPDKNKQAQEALRKAMSLNPSYAMAFMWYANTLEDPDEQLDYYEQAMKLDPRSAVAAYNVANIYEHQRRDAEAMQLFSTIVRADPYYAKAYELVGRINSRRGQLGEAVRQYTTSYELMPDTYIGLNISKLYADLGEFEKSDEWFEKVSADVPAEFRARVDWYRIGRFIAAGDEATTNEMLTRIKTYPGEDLEAEYNRLLVDYYQDRVSDVIERFEAARDQELGFEKQDKYTKDLSIRVALAVADIQMRLGERDAAIKRLDQVTGIIDNLEVRDRLENEWYYRAQIAAIKGQPERAMVYLQRGVDEGWREHWLPQYDPSLREVVRQETFKSLMAGLQNRLNIIRNQFAMDAEFATNWSG